MPDGRAIIVSDYVVGGSAASGGAGHAVRDSYRALRDTGVDARVIAAFGGAGDIEPDRFTSLGRADVREAGAAGAFRAIYDPGARAALATALAGEDPERTVVILHQWTRALTPASVGLLGRFPLMVYMHDYFWPCPNGAYFDYRQQRPCTRQPLGARCVTADCDRAGRVAKVGRLVRHAALRHATADPSRERLFVHVSAQAMATAAPLLPGERHAVVHNPSTAARATERDEPRFDFGYFGRVEPEKGLMSLLKAADRLGLTGLLVGDGSLEPEIRARPTLEHRRWQPRDEVAAAMRSCGVVVLPSLWPETWGLVVPEAMLAGVPVLVSERAGSAELVERFGGGAVFDPDYGIANPLALLLHHIARDDPALALDRDGLTRFLSMERHARGIMALADQHWGIRLGRPERAADFPPTVSAMPRAAPQPVAM